MLSMCIHVSVVIIYYNVLNRYSSCVQRREEKTSKAGVKQN